MIKSMTGFSRFEAKENGINATVEIKTLNARYLEYNNRLPKALSFKELEVRDIAKQYISRGTVSITITIDYDDDRASFTINEKIATDYYNSLKNLSDKLQLKDPVKLEHLIPFSNYFVEKDETDTFEEEWKVVKSALADALVSLDKMRSREGQQLLKDFQTRVASIEKSVDEIESLTGSRMVTEREKMRQRVAQLFESDEIDETRIQMEIVILANKLDISEEIVRIRSHIKFFISALESTQPVGQKLNFLLQEMNREINTMGSKSDNAEISQIVVCVKEELERIREQVQNIE